MTIAANRGERNEFHQKNRTFTRRDALLAALGLGTSAVALSISKENNGGDRRPTRQGDKTISLTEWILFKEKGTPLPVGAKVRLLKDSMSITDPRKFEGEKNNLMMLTASHDSQYTIAGINKELNTNFSNGYVRLEKADVDRSGCGWVKIIDLEFVDYQ